MATNIDIKSKDGKSVGKHTLSEALTKIVASSTTVHRAVVAEEANARQGTQSALTRAEVRGGGRKPYKQKKTGNARQGTVSAPHYTHGGQAFAVKPRDYDKKVNKKERRAAILSTLVQRVDAGDVTVADKIFFAEPKTKQATEMLKALDLLDARRLLVVLPQNDANTYKCFRNVPNVTVRTAPSSQAEGAEGAKTSTFSVRDILVATKILIAKDALTQIEEVWAK